jgi:MYXO-CTERM domain-containing protein
MGYTLAATGAGLTGATSTPFDISSGAAAQLAFSVQPASASLGSKIPTVQVSVLDAQMNGVQEPAVSVSVTLGSNPSGATLSGTLVVSAMNGVATFSDLTVDHDGAGYQLTASATGAAPVMSNAFSVWDAPHITHDASLIATVDVPYRYNATGAIQATGSALLAYSSCSSVPGLTVDAGTGAVSWTPNAVGTVDVCVAAHNAGGDDTYAFTVSVLAAPLTGGASQYGRSFAVGCGCASEGGDHASVFIGWAAALSGIAAGRHGRRRVRA